MRCADERAGGDASGGGALVEHRRFEAHNSFRILTNGLEFIGEPDIRESKLLQF